MTLSKMPWFRVAVDALHSLAAGVGTGAVLSLWLVRGGARTVLDPLAFAGLTRSWTWILLILLLSLVVLVVTGAIRLGHLTAGVEPEAVNAKVRAALVKHLLFMSIFIGSAVAAFTLLQP